MEKTYYGDLEVHLEVVLPKDLPNDAQVTSSFVLPIKNKQLLLTKNPRGWDILGGHVENNEAALETAVREAQEEGGVLADNPVLIGAIKVTNPNWTKESQYPKVAYQCFYLAREFELEPMNDEFECTDRAFFSLEDVPDTHHNWLKSHSKLLKLVE